MNKIIQRQKQKQSVDFEKRFVCSIAYKICRSISWYMMKININLFVTLICSHLLALSPIRPLILPFRSFTEKNGSSTKNNEFH